LVLSPATVLVEVTYLAGLELGYARATLVDHEERKNVIPGNHVRDTLDVLSERRWDVRLALLRQLHSLVACWVRVDRVVVKALCERGPRLPYCLALVCTHRALSPGPVFGNVTRRYWLRSLS